MSTIVDSQIETMALCDGLISPYCPSQLNPASYDVRLGANILVETTTCEWKEVKLPWVLDPGEFVLGVTKELFRIPDYIEAVFQLKSSRGREGYEHVLSGYIDPGFTGRVTLELVNVNRYRPLPLTEGMLIGQIRFMKTDQPCRRSYKETGHYNLDLTVQPSKVDNFGTLIQNHD
jgi:dCTP deaminase